MKIGNLKKIAFIYPCTALLFTGCTFTENSENGADSGEVVENSEISTKNSGNSDQKTGQSSEDMSFTDDQALKSATVACEQGNFRNLLDAFITSSAVRQKYSEPEVTIVTLERNGETSQYSPTNTQKLSAATAASDRYFPLAMMDNYYVLSGATYAAQGYKMPKTPDYVKLDVDQGQNEAFNVAYTPTKYVSDGTEEGDSLGKAVGTFGDTGDLLFNPDGGNCWRLAEIRISKNGGVRD